MIEHSMSLVSPERWLRIPKARCPWRKPLSPSTAGRMMMMTSYVERVAFDAEGHLLSSLERWIDALDHALEPLTNFILPVCYVSSTFVRVNTDLLVWWSFVCSLACCSCCM